MRLSPACSRALPGLAATLLLASWSPTPAAAQISVPEAEVTTVTVPPLVDGVLEEEVWELATPMGDFIQRVPRDGDPASETTEVRILQDDEALYVGFWLWDSRPASIVPGESIRDFDLQQSDAVLLILDTFRDQQNALVFGTNPAGIEYDGQVAEAGQGGGGFFGGGRGGNRRQQSGAGGGFNLNWDGSWNVATSRDARGWYAEFRIPFSTLRYGAGESQTWAVNVVRRVRRLNEQSFWAPVPREFDQFRLNYAGTLRGVRAPAKRLATVTPYVLAQAVRNWQAGDDHFRYPGDVGGDTKVQVTPSLTLDGTWNTDFAQVEVDDAQVNLTRFSIQFPEKRPFFLENAGFFQVGAGGAELFFSRRIGITDRGEAVPITGGGRLSGKFAGFNVGLLQIRTEGVPGLAEATDYQVARVARELPNRSRLGAAFLRRAGSGTNDWNHAVAVDGQLGIGEPWTFTGFVAQTATPGLEGREHAWNVQGGFTNRRFNASMTVREIGGEFNPEMGFLPRDDHRYYQAFAMVYFRPERWGIREIRPHASYFTFRDIDTGFQRTSRLHLDAHVEWEDGMEVHPAFNWVREGLERPFEISEGVVVPPGVYDGWESALVFFTDDSAPFSFNGGMNAGRFLSGTRVNPFGTFTFRPGSSFSTSLRLEYNDVNLEEGAFQVALAGLRLAYFLTPSIYVQSLTQYADQNDAWSTNIRFGWLDTAGTGLFVVFNQANGFGALALDTPLNRSLTIKYTRMFDVLQW